MFIIDTLGAGMQWLLTLYLSFTAPLVALGLLSLSVFVVMLPLYWLGDRIVLRDKRKKAIMQEEMDSVGKLSNTQKKYFYTQEIYRRYGYSPLQSLTGLIGLAIQVPFFIAAYRMLHEYSDFSGVSAGIFHDLFAPDGLLQLWGIPIHVLPLLMTGLNLLSAYYYTLADKKRDVLQLFLFPTIFLVLLYQQPVALVFYWTMNNVWSLLKNFIGAQRKGLPLGLPILQLGFWRGGVNRFIENKSAQKISQSPIFIAVFMGLLVYLLTIVALYKNSEAPDTIERAREIAILIFDLLLAWAFYKNRLQIFFINKGHLFQLNIVKIILIPINIYLIYNILTFHIFKVFHISLYTHISNSSYLLIYQVILLFILSIFYRDSYRLKRYHNSLSIWNILIFSLLPTCAILNLIYTNLDYFTIQNSILTIIGTIFLIFLFIFIIDRILFCYKNSQEIGISITCIFTAYLLTPSILPVIRLNNNNSLYWQIFFFLTLTIIFQFLYKRNKKFIQIVLVALFLSNLSLYTYRGVSQPESFAKTIKDNEQNQDESDSHFYAGRKPEIENKDKKFTQSLLNKIEKTPDIYLLIYDGYPNIHMMDYYGINNKEQFDFLIKNNFTFYDEVYSLWHNSVKSISNTLEFVHYPELEQTTESLRRKFVAGDNITNYILRSKNYNTYNLLRSNYMFLGNEPSTTFTSPRPSLSNTDVLSGLLYGEFKFDRNLDTTNLLGLLGKNSNLSSEELQNIKSNIFSDASISPKFVYTHIGPGHAQLSGKCLPNETELFEHRLQKANYFMQQDVNAIASSNKNAIIIIAGDHGPYLTKNCRYFEGIPENEITARDIVDRLGMFMAIKWPQDYRETTKIETLQDAMPAVFSYMTNAKISNSDQKPVQKKSYLVDTLMIENGIIQYGKDKGKPLYYWLDKK